MSFTRPRHAEISTRSPDLNRSHRDLTTSSSQTSSFFTNTYFPTPLRYVKVGFISFTYIFSYLPHLRTLPCPPITTLLPLLLLLSSLFFRHRHVFCVSVGSSIFYMPSPSHLQVTQ